MLEFIEPIAYTPDAFVFGQEQKDVTGLTIQLGVETLYQAILPAVEVGPDPDTGAKDTIFYLNVNPKNDERLMHAAAESLAELIIASPDITAIVTPNSHKSIPCMGEAVRIANKKSGKDIKFIVLLGEKEESSVRACISTHNVHYFPITTPEGKWAGIMKEDKERLLGAAPNPKHVLIVDDVYSRGGTIDGVFELLNGIYHRPKDTEFSVAVIAVEQPITDLDPKNIPPYIRSVIIIPEIPGQPAEH